MKKFMAIVFSISLFSVVLTQGAYASSPAEIPTETGRITRFMGFDAQSGIPPLCDGFGYVWNLSISGPGTLNGTVDTGGCGVWTVSGSYTSSSVTLHATNPSPKQGCCTAFTYTGTYSRRSKSASGSWTNVCGGSGSWTMGLCH